MLTNVLILAVSSSIDSFGIGITYGIKNTKILLTGKIVLFLISLIITFFSVTLGNTFKKFLSENICTLLGSLILIFIGIFIMYNALKKEKAPSKNNNNFFKNPMVSDFDKSNTIDFKESIFLGVALSLDSFCIGIGGSIINISLIFFPIFVSFFQFFFLSIGSILGNKINRLCSLPENVWSVISALLLILIGIVKLFT